MPSGDAQICIDEACAFLTISKELIDQTDMVGLSSMLYPVVVNAAFSCELSLKAIMMMRSSNNEFGLGHRLKTDLYPQLCARDRDEIEKRANASLALAFDDALTEFDNAFIHWGYAFEKGVSIHYLELVKFAELLLDYAKELAA